MTPKKMTGQTDMGDYQGKILLVLMPFWTPLIPPMGISCLKSFLNKYGYHVKNVDVNVVESLRAAYDAYFSQLRNMIPGNKRGNFISIGQDVLRNHMMAHFNAGHKEEYEELVKILVRQTFYIEADDWGTRELVRIIADFYDNLEKYFIDLLDREKPAVLGFSLFNGTLPASLFAARLAKRRHPHLQVVLGGGVFADQLAPGTPNMDYFLKVTGGYVDKIIIGEGENLFHRYLQGQLPPERKVVSLEDINRKLMDINSADPPDFFDLDLGVYPYLAAYTSRSCPFQCKFCSETVQWGDYRKKRGEQIVRELVQLNQQHGFRMFFMADSLLNPVINELAREFIKSDITLYWDGCIRADRPVCDTRNTFLWRRGGFYRARLGIESGSARVLELMGKRITVEQSARALESLATAGIKTSTLWVIGFHGETEDDFQQTLKFIEENRNYIYDAEGTPFWYHLGGQTNSREWTGQDKNELLYPGWAKPMLVTQTWILAGTPSRQETYERLNRFAALLDNLGIPNPYTLHDIHEADERWKRLHQNAVPSLLEIRDSAGSVENCREIEEQHYLLGDGKYWQDFDF